MISQHFNTVIAFIFLYKFTVALMTVGDVILSFQSPSSYLIQVAKMFSTFPLIEHVQ